MLLEKFNVALILLYFPIMSIKRINGQQQQQQPPVHNAPQEQHHQQFGGEAVKDEGYGFSFAKTKI